MPLLARQAKWSDRPRVTPFARSEQNVSGFCVLAIHPELENFKIFVSSISSKLNVFQSKSRWKFKDIKIEH